MGFWDVLLFNIATVLGPRWIAAAGHNGTSSISLWVLAAVFFFVPGALVINELSSRFPEEGGLYVWAREAFGDFHGFIAGWTYWIYTVFYFPGLLLASASMAAYIIGGRGCCARAGPHLPALRLAGLAAGRGGAQHRRPQHRQVAAERRRRRHLCSAGDPWSSSQCRCLVRHGSATHFTLANMLPTWNWDTVNFWSQIAFAFTGLELVSAMSEEIRDPRRTLPRAVFGAGALIALMYIAGTFAILALVPAADLDPQSGVFQRHHRRAPSRWRRLPRHRRRHPRHRRQCRRRGLHSRRHRARSLRCRHRPLSARGLRQNPSALEDAYVSILVQAVVSGSNPARAARSTTRRAAPISSLSTPPSSSTSFHFSTCSRRSSSSPAAPTAREPARRPRPRRAPGVWICGGLGFARRADRHLCFARAARRTSAALGFELQLVIGTVVSILIGLALYWRGVRTKTAQS